MPCKCGGELKQINSNNYQCKNCGKLFATASLSLPLESGQPIISINTRGSYKNREFIKNIEKEIINSLKIPSHLINKR